MKYQVGDIIGYNRTRSRPYKSILLILGSHIESSEELICDNEGGEELIEYGSIIYYHVLHISPLIDKHRLIESIDEEYIDEKIT